MSKTETPTEREVLELFTDSLRRTGEGMITLAQSLEAKAGGRPLDEEEKRLLRFAVIGQFQDSMKEVAYWTVSGCIKEACEVLFNWIHRLQKLD